VGTRPGAPDRSFNGKLSLLLARGEQNYQEIVSRKTRSVISGPGEEPSRLIKRPTKFQREEKLGEASRCKEKNHRSQVGRTKKKEERKDQKNATLEYLLASGAVIGSANPVGAGRGKEGALRDPRE